MVGIYARQSIDKKDSISIESQIEFAKKELLNNEEFKIYVDKGYSGKNIERPAFKELERDIKAGLINKVIVYRLDRISRSVLDFAQIIELFEKHDVSFTSCTEKFDTSTPVGRAMLSIVIVFAQLERETIQERMIDNYYARGLTGVYMGGPPPYGYKRKEIEYNGRKVATLEPDPETAPIVKEIFELYAKTDMSLGKLTKYLNNKNYVTMTGVPWASHKLSPLLKNPIYVKADADIYLYYKNKNCKIHNDISEFIGTNACFLYGKRDPNERKFTRVDDHHLVITLHEGLIDSETWLACQYKLENNKQIKNSGKGKHTWLTGLIKCGYCGYAITAVQFKNIKYFRCSGKINSKHCQGFSHPIHIEKVQNIIEPLLIEKAKKEMANITIEEEINNTALNQIKLQILEIDNQIESLINELLNGNEVVKKYLNNKITELDEKKNKLLEDYKKTHINNSNTKFITSKEFIEKVDNWNKLNIEEKKSIAHSFINKVILKDNYEITIEWIF